MAIEAPAPSGPHVAPQYPVIYTLAYPERRSRPTVGLRLFLVLPHLLALIAVSWLLYPLALANWLIIVFSGRLDRTIWGFTASILHWLARVLTYLTLLRDEFPPFGGGAYPLRFEIPFPQRRSRLRTLFRLVLILPQLVVAGLLLTPLLIGAVIVWFAILISRQYPEGIWRLAAGLNRWILRVAAYGLLLRDDYPPYTLGLWESATVAALVVEPPVDGPATAPAAPAREPHETAHAAHDEPGFTPWPAELSPPDAAQPDMRLHEQQLLEPEEPSALPDDPAQE
ncbi:MAG TPA: DUF4389 domain-containing protein [Dehalococcoidia bacterium]